MFSYAGWGQAAGCGGDYLGVGVSYMGTTHALQLEGAYDVGGELLGVSQRHAHHAVRLRPAARPVLNTQ